ncbi:unnamed protein product [Pleuronectes platessa]|uniref:Uncharacterized protein n=1 Tax=Pleuronectes platessa TaxID=8262 RepID=A0A9N7U7S2_PLEPL|nr:unnamed protein product [Pleuronectes platessa]
MCYESLTTHADSSTRTRQRAQAESRGRCGSRPGGTQSSNVTKLSTLSSAQPGYHQTHALHAAPSGYSSISGVRCPAYGCNCYPTQLTSGRGLVLLDAAELC